MRSRTTKTGHRIQFGSFELDDRCETTTLSSHSPKTMSPPNFEIEIVQPAGRFKRWIRRIFRSMTFRSDRNLDIIIRQRQAGEQETAFSITCFAGQDGTLTITVESEAAVRFKKRTER